EDRCRGPGNLFFVEPSGEVKPCCGYASESPALSIGNIKRDPVSRIVENARQNRIVYAIFNSGLSGIRKRLGGCGVKFPGKTSNNCFFCHYILERYGKKIRSLYHPGSHPV
ncbi:MAG: SPASM domain-containing protein, partial [Candidatus Omnitrophica bacterium]|nr:SPASM domain-containing protein [Candidatus Omnitrophota bacterium]